MVKNVQLWFLFMIIKDPKPNCCKSMKRGQERRRKILTWINLSWILSKLRYCDQKIRRWFATGNWVFLLRNGHFSSSLSLSTNINSPKSPFDGVCLSSGLGQIIMCQTLWTMTRSPLVCHRVSRHMDDDGCLSRIREFPYLHFNIKTRHRQTPTQA